MDCQRRDAKDRFVNFDQLRSMARAAIVCHYDAPSNRKVTIKPRMPYTPTVSEKYLRKGAPFKATYRRFNGNLNVTQGGLLGGGPNTKVWAVYMCRNN
jgi:hypothetical protein